MLIDIIKVFIL